jgi:hypothetical protein
VRQTATSILPVSATLPNGSGAAAILSAGIGCFMIPVFAIAAGKSAAINNLFVFYKPTGPLSGVTTSAIVVWLIAWAFLDWRWRRRTVALRRTNAVAFLLLGLSLLLTFPSLAEIF